MMLDPSNPFTLLQKKNIWIHMKAAERHVKLAIYLFCHKV